MTVSAAGLALVVTVALAAVALSPFVLLYLLIKDIRKGTPW